MIDIFHEELIPLTAAARLLPGKPHLSTLYRFILRGIRGVRLETVVSGGRRFTSHEALRRFVEATTLAANTPTRSLAAVPVLPPVDRDDLDRQLERKGL